MKAKNFPVIKTFKVGRDLNEAIQKGASAAGLSESDFIRGVVEHYLNDGGLLDALISARPRPVKDFLNWLTKFRGQELRRSGK